MNARVLKFCIIQISHEKIVDPYFFSCPSCQICPFLELQVNLIITLSLGSMETDRVISEPCYNEVIYNRHIAK